MVEGRGEGMMKQLEKVREDSLRKIQKPENLLRKLTEKYFDLF